MSDNDETIGGQADRTMATHHKPLTREQIRDLLRMLADAFEAEDEDAERNAATADGMADGTQDDAVQGRTD